MNGLHSRSWRNECPTRVEFAAPTRISAGVGRRRAIGQVVASLGARRAYVMCGSHFAGTEEFADIAANLDGAFVAGTDDVGSHATIDILRRIVADVKESDADIIVAVGGGSVIDMAKCVAASIGGNRDFLQLTHSVAKPDADHPVPARCPIVALPTTAGSASETNCMGGVLVSDETGTTSRVPSRDPHVAPRVALLDPELTVSLSPRLTVTTGANAFAHCVEVLYSVDRDPLSTALALEAARIMFVHLPRCVANPDDLGARGLQQVATAMSGLALGNTMVGLHHALCHGLGDLHHTAHGDNNAVMLPHAMRFNLKAAGHAIYRLGECLGVVRPGDSTEEGGARTVEAVDGWLTSMGAPKRLREISKLSPDDLLASARLASISPCIPFNPTPAPGVDELFDIYRVAW